MIIQIDISFVYHLFRLLKNSVSLILQLYSEFLTEYENLGHMVRVPDISRCGSAIGGRGGGKTLAHAVSASGGSG